MTDTPLPKGPSVYRPILRLLLLAVTATATRSLAFSLDENVTEMCIVLKGVDTGRTLSCYYTIVGLNPESVKFIVKDLTAKETLKELDNSPVADRVAVSIPVNFKHEFLLCWRNTDSERKLIEFAYTQIGKVNVIDTGELKRRRGVAQATDHGLPEPSLGGERGYQGAVHYGGFLRKGSRGEGQEHPDKLLLTSGGLLRGRVIASWHIFAPDR